MQKIEEAAYLSVARGCGFALLAIAVFMFALSPDVAKCFQAGGILGLIVCAVLSLRAYSAPTKPYKRTEVWLMLSPADRPPAELAQIVVGMALERTYMKFALHFAVGAGALIGASALWKLFRAITQ